VNESTLYLSLPKTDEKIDFVALVIAKDLNMIIVDSIQTIEQRK
jgi:hypothetical protein